MSRFYILALLAALAAMAVAEWVGQDSGYVLIMLGDTSVEMTFWVALIFLLLAFTMFYYLARMFLLLNSAMQRLLHPQQLKTLKPGRLDRTSRAASHFIAGDWSRAEKQLMRAAAKSEAPMLNYLLAARASHEAGDTGRAEQYLGLAEDQGSGAQTPVILTRAELQLQSGRASEALASLDALKAAGVKHPVALRLRIDALRSTHNWDGLLTQIPIARKRQTLPGQRLDELEQEATLGTIEAAAAQPAGSEHALRERWKSVPARLRRDSVIAARYCSLLSARDGADEAERILRKLIKGDFSETLVSLYGQIETSDAAQQLKVAETWLKDRPTNAPLLLCLGRLCLLNRLWGKAREYLVSSVEIDPTVEACAELGRLYERLGETDNSRLVLARALSVTTAALPALPLPDQPEPVKEATGQLTPEQSQ